MLNSQKDIASPGVRHGLQQEVAGLNRLPGRTPETRRPAWNLVKSRDPKGSMLGERSKQHNQETKRNTANRSPLQGQRTGTWAQTESNGQQIGFGQVYPGPPLLHVQAWNWNQHVPSILSSLLVVWIGGKEAVLGSFPLSLKAIQNPHSKLPRGA